MVVMEILSRLVTKGSDGLVHAMYRRLRADRVPGSTSLPLGHPIESWREIADQAMAEGVLTPKEAARLRGLACWPEAPARAPRPVLPAAIARQGDAR